MKKIWILLFTLQLWFPIFGQQNDIRVVLLGASHAHNCEFNNEGRVILLNHSVADFTSGQLLWTIDHGVINHSPDICIVQTGSLDILLGIPREKVIDNLDIFFERFKEEGIRMMIMEDFPYWLDSSLNEESEHLNQLIRDYAKENEIKYISLKESYFNGNEINPGEKPILSNSGCIKFQSLILKAIENEE